MKPARHRTDQIVKKLRRSDVELGKRQKFPEVCHLTTHSFCAGTKGALGGDS
jgi:hypothetical protein